MTYAERAYFTPDACAHCAARDEQLRLGYLVRRSAVMVAGRARGA